MLNKQTYRLGPLTLVLATTDPQQAQQVVACWRHLFCIEPGLATAVTGQTMCLRLEQSALPTDMAALPAQPLSAVGSIQVWQTNRGLHCRCGATVFQIDPIRPEAVGHVAADFGDYSLVEQRSFWQTLFFLLVRRAGCAFLHANALYPEAWGPEAGVLLVGDCGTGKTSLTLSLITAGWRYVTDDTVLLQPIEHIDTPPSGKGPNGAAETGVRMAPSRKGSSLHAHAVRRGFACTEQTLARWPWLAALAASGAALNRQKTLIALDALYPASFAPTCAPRVLFFPRIADTAQSQVRALTRAQSFTGLLGQPHNGLLAEPAFTGALLTLFHSLVEQTDSYQLDLGLDVFTEPAQVSALLMGVLSSCPMEAIAV